MRKRSLTVLLSVVVLMLAMIAPASAAEIQVDTPSNIHVTVSMPNGSVHVIDTVFDVQVVHIGDHAVELDIRMLNGLVVSGNTASGFIVLPPDGGGFCNLCLP